MMSKIIETVATQPLVSLSEADRHETALQIMNVAEQLFAESGFNGVPLRLLTKEAGVNLAAVNYHFGSKEGLFEAIFVQRLAPLIEGCLKELEVLETEQQKLTLDSLLQTVIRPCLALAKDPKSGGAIFVRLLSRTLLENHRQVREMIAGQYGEFVQRYLRAFHQALPQLNAEQLAWRMHFAFSVMFNAFAGNDVLKVFTRSEVVSARDPDIIVKHVLPFVTAGLLAPVER
ncbi:TetR family transcriptional regulator [Neisseriaceae bacterium TC5R-5]|nr:TetR family transcriptional regulator [Neisseriaceae bacterium TC5R-5]